MPRAASVWLDVLPSMAEFRRQLRRELEEPIQQSATRAGEEGGESLMSSLGGKIKGGALALGAAGGALMVKGLEQAMDKQKATGKLKAQLGLTARDAQRAGQAAGRLYTDAVTESVEDGATAVRAIMSAGLAPPQATTRQLAAIATKAQDLASLFEVDMPQAANAAGQAVKTGLAKNAREAFDVMVRGFQVMGPRADDLVDTFNEYSVQWQSLGLDAKQATGLIAQALAGGARDTDIAADALKEFNLRARDITSTAPAGFKSLGLNAKQMAADVAAGGPRATKALQTTLDALRKYPDSSKKASVAAAIFGTQSEDMQKALLKMDPSKATAALGKVGGAAKQAGTDLRDNAGTSFEQFKRRALMAIGDATATYAIPALTRFGRTLNTDVLPEVKTTTKVLAGVLVPAVKTTAVAFAGGARWLRDYGVWLTPLAIAIAGVTLALNAEAIATGAVAVVFGIYRAVILTGTAVTEGFTAAQALLNAVMELNPITLVVIALVALGAALVIAWKKSDTFRSVVMGAWKGIQTAALWAWNNALKPAMDGIVTAARAVGTAAVWLWDTVLKPVFSAIATAAKTMATVVTILAIGPMILAFKLLAPVVTWLWQSVIRPAFQGIAALAMWLYTNAIAPQLHAIQAAIHTAGAVATWLWRNAFSPALHGIAAAAVWLYDHAIKPQFALVRTALSALGSGLKTLRDAGKTALHGLADVVVWLYTKTLKPQLDAGKRLVHSFGDAFRAAKDAISTQWHKLEGIAKKPVQFVVDTVYNHGLRGVWNKVAKAFGAPTLPAFKFAAGGVLPGYTPGRDPHEFWSPTGGRLAMSGGEAIMRPEFTRGVGPTWVAWMNRLARTRGSHGVRQAMAASGAGQQFAGGGIFGWVGSTLKGAGSKVWKAVSKSAHWLKDTVAASARAGVRAAVDPLLARLPGTGTGFGKMIRAIPTRMVDALFGYAKTADKKGAGASAAAAGGGQLGRWIARAMALAHVPATWAVPLRTLIMRESGGNPRAINLWDSNAQHGDPSRGLMQTIGATFAHYRLRSLPDDIYDPIANIVAGIRYILARYGSIFHVQQAVGATPKGYAAGGRPRPGELAWVGEAGPELVRFRGGETVYPHQQSLAMATGLAARGFASGTTGAAARKQLPGDLTAWTKSLTGSASDIAKAAKDLTHDLTAAGGAGRALAKSTAAAATKLEGMAKRRDAIAGTIAEAKSAASDQAKTASDFIGLSNLSDATTTADVLAGLRSRQATVKGFQAQITALANRGLSQDLIGQLVAMGPDSTLAGVLRTASGAQIKQLNALATSGAKLSTGYGRVVADEMYDAGGQAARGFLAGLLDQQKDIQKAMAKLGAGAVKAIRSKEGIDAHSPSRKGAAAGRDVGAGLVAGMAAAGPQVAEAAQRLAAAAVPAGGIVPATATARTAPAPLLAPGQRLRLVVGEHEMDAYVDGRVDQGLDDVRRSKRAGSKP